MGIDPMTTRCLVVALTTKLLGHRAIAHAVPLASPLASARQHPPENQKENQAGHSSERAVRAGFFFWFHGIFAGMGNRFFLAREAFFAREREKKLLCFKSVFGVFWCFWCFLVFFLFFAR